ncbi:MAG: HAD family hydrolase [Deltaproteobacteria bacterium]|nr:HAD family hydrolase [Deltaproteobacteria bacterium]MBW1923297.1 HAD family hydrolase [Deltaproteobacteria bacterium]MBW1951112.1 HAD family hydrolase [Deltaproteobacteria bacterium]MBW2009295.1 HAD family hydrolase [Deltaproteobacteria bacterium]MBW2103733.1 HAD family hydrolase [Deltaproteobacteria bacterium]
MKPAVFLDRDGTVNEQMGYINHPSRFVMLPGAAEAIARLNHAGYLVIVVTNQSGVARGYFPEELVVEVHAMLKQMLGRRGAHVDGIYYCPHHPRGKVEGYRKTCECRKPGTGLVKRACKDFEIDMACSFMVGDRYSDVEMGHRLGLPSVMVKTGYGRGDLRYVVPTMANGPDFVADDLKGAVDWILNHGKAGAGK